MSHLEDISTPWIELPSDTKEFIVEHTRHMAESLMRLTGRGFYPHQNTIRPDQLAAEVYKSPFVLVAHNTEENPILNYGNQCAQNLWEMPWEELTATPSRETAEVAAREERERFLAEVSRKGFSDDYRGVRISKKGQRFTIGPATVWNIDDSDQLIGQAAMFREWQFI